MFNGKSFKEWSKEVKFQEWKVEDMIKWCQEHGQVAWLKETAAKKVERKTYPKVPYTNKNGKASYKEDKTQEPTVTEERITLSGMKSEFKSKFFPTEAKAKKQDWHDLIASL